MGCNLHLKIALMSQLNFAVDSRLTNKCFWWVFEIQIKYIASNPFFNNLRVSTDHMLFVAILFSFLSSTFPDFLLLINWNL